MYRAVVGIGRKLVAAGLLLVAAAAPAAEYVLPANGDNVIGSNTSVIAAHEDTLFDVARRNGVGYDEILAANPGVDPWMPGEGTEILIPARYILPDAPREGIVVNLPEHRMYYYPPAKQGEPHDRAHVPDQHGEDGLEHAARRDEDRHQGEAAELVSAGVRAQGARGAR